MSVDTKEQLFATAGGRATTFDVLPKLRFPSIGPPPQAACVAAARQNWQAALAARVAVRLVVAPLLDQAS